MTDVLTCFNPDLVKNNYYANKFDVTAWNDFGAEPRAHDFMTKGTHSGSRHAMFNLRKIVSREKCQGLLDVAEAKKPKFSTRRTVSAPSLALAHCPLATMLCPTQ
jgi:hypothetical protein